MSSFVSSGEYVIQTEKEVSDALSNFSPEFIMGTLEYRFEPDTFQINNPNIPSTFENYFKQLKIQYPMFERDINQTRYETYMEILRIICKKRGLVFNENIEGEIYTYAFYMYDFFVANYTSYITTFFSNFIIKEKNGIYDMTNLAQFKKNKDTSTIYNKRIQKNNKIAIINSNLEFVLNNIGNIDISLADILLTVYGNPNIVNIILTACQPLDDFYHSNYLAVLNSSLRPVLITNIRLAIQSMTVNNNLDINITDQEPEDQDN